MKLFIADITLIQLGWIDMLSPQRAEKARRYKKTDDQKRCIAGELLIMRFLKNAVVTENEFGKPMADNGVHFNLSHSGKYVLFALSDCEVGCDIEQVRSINAEKAGKIVFCRNETDKLSNAVDKTGEFLKMWTKKESLLKCIGEGFHRNAKSVDVSSDIFTEKGKNYYLKTWNFSDYVISVCSADNNFPSIIEFTDFSLNINER